MSVHIANEQRQVVLFDELIDSNRRLSWQRLLKYRCEQKQDLTGSSQLDSATAMRGQYESPMKGYLWPVTRAPFIAFYT